MTPAGKCEACGRSLYDPESIARRLGPHCAEKRGVLTRKPRVRKARQQLPLDFATPPGLDGVAPAAWPWVLEARASAAARGLACPPDCPGAYMGVCAAHAPKVPYEPPSPRVGPPAPPRDISLLPPPGLSMGKRRRSVVRSPKT